MSNFLYQKIENFFDGVDKPNIPLSITNNLKYPLRHLTFSNRHPILGLIK